MKSLLLPFLSASFLFASNISLQYKGIEVIHTYLNNQQEKFTIEREIAKDCINIGISPEYFTEQNIRNNTSNKCKKTIITSTGIIQPLYINDKIKTVSELEVLNFILNKSSKEPQNYALVDSRKSSWFNQATIPSAINIPYEDLRYDEDFKEEFFKAYENLNAKIIDFEKNIYDFSNAKTIISFCNGSWCPISTKAIEYLVSIGYPAEKIMWYRGGMAEWTALSMTVTKELKN
ncbi:MAG: rhodanese-like domain-containing protein [Aliarcobacter sp.]|uniref:rhodanese-like domain-containing protein n=1 Tax=Arcobacter aquimarinus TaxID=1315211 RepID=UPI0013E94116|nr:rhodanese-like domain-containing protein [Arcobacter aquimarinus]MCB9096792.1 rhodanese-like domain-containing protein [Arcobacter sp.]